MGMHLGHQGCADTKERARMPTRLAFRTILGSSENGVALVPETGIEQNDPIPAEPAIPIATKTK
jgi:hypothetical protein